MWFVIGCGLVISGVFVDALLIFQLPQEEGGLLFHVVEDFYLVGEVGNVGYFGYECVDFLLEVVVH